MYCLEVVFKFSSSAAPGPKLHRETIRGLLALQVLQWVTYSAGILVGIFEAFR